MKIATGLDRLVANKSFQKKYKGNIAYLCHNASIDSKCREGLYLMKSIFGQQLKSVFSPQHGFFSDAQDNMIESGHFVHPHYQVPVYSLYSETRSPSDKMLDGIDHIFVDLQDVGCRAYTFIYTMILLMDACGDKDIEVIILDRPNPLNGNDIEGNLLEEEFKSFIGLHPLPFRHGLTIGEVAKMAVKYWSIDCKLEIINMQGWQRSMYFEETRLPWVFPSPNIPSLNSVNIFPATVILEGTNLSEGRGTTCPFELFGHPEINPYDLLNTLNKVFDKYKLTGFILRPTYFKPTFDKYVNRNCGGFQIHVTDKNNFKPWRTGQVLLQELFHFMENNSQWRPPPFEYEEKLLPIDMINGTDQLRHWIEEEGGFEKLINIEKKGIEKFMADRGGVLIY